MAIFSNMLKSIGKSLGNAARTGKGEKGRRETAKPRETNSRGFAEILRRLPGLFI